MFAPAAAAGLLIIVPAFAPAQSEPAKQQPQQPPRSTAQESRPGDNNQIELFEDRSFVLVGRVVRKDGQVYLRIKSLPGMGGAAGQKPGAAGNEKDGKGKASDAAGAQDAQGAASQKRKTGQRRMLQLNEDVQLLKSAMLEDLEEDVGLKDVAGKKDEEATPLIQLQGILTMYRSQPYLFVQSYRTSNEQDTSRHDEKKDEKKKD
jgi:hypothetical protein